MRLAATPQAQAAGLGLLVFWLACSLVGAGLGVGLVELVARRRQS